MLAFLLAHLMRIQLNAVVSKPPSFWGECSFAKPAKLLVEDKREISAFLSFM